MNINSANFVMSNTDYKKCPEPLLPEYAFVGRSNVGKSSLINMICGNKTLAKTSSTPGKTQLINHFIINENWYLVDLPGYGYAKTGNNLIGQWNKFTSAYLQKRENLMCTFVLIDIRLEPQKNDTEFMENMAIQGLPFVMVFTKADKLGSVAAQRNVDNYLKKMEETWIELPQYFITSAEKKIGAEEILTFVENTNKLFTPPKQYTKNRDLNRKK
ncbi:MAG: ribosome biogenesis GTP-binding protein YihA/YsxC [Bacteroidales bacterium]|nr:ribosome biogenesis GTP-binding protein YihA/YsxC [Bacteroidales bacterium]